MDRTSCSILMEDHAHRWMERDHPGQLDSIITIHQIATFFIDINIIIISISINSHLISALNRDA